MATIGRTEGVGGLFLQLSANALLVAAQVQVARHLGGVLEVDAVVLYRVGQRARALQPDAAAHALEVQRLVALHHAEHLVHVVFRVLVVVHRRLQYRRNPVVLPSGDDDVAHSLGHAVHRHIAVLVDHVVAFIQGYHPIRAVLVYHVGLQHLRIAQVGAVCPHQVHVRRRAVGAQSDIRRARLVHAVRGAALHRAGHDAVDIQVHHLRVPLLVVARPVRALGEAHEGHLVHLAGGHLHRQLAFAPGHHTGFLRRDDEARAVRVHAADDFCVLVRHLAHLVLHDEGHRVRHVLLRLCQRAVLHGGARRVGQTQGLACPAVAAPLEAFEHGSNAVVAPFLPVHVAVAPPLGRQLQRHAVRRLAEVQVALFGNKAKFERGASYHNPALLLAVVGGAQRQVLRRERHGGGRGQRATHIHVRPCRGFLGVVGGILQGVAVVLLRLDVGGLALFGDCPVRIVEPRGHQRRVVPGLPDAHGKKDAVALYRAPVRQFQFHHELHRVRAVCQVRGRYGEAAVGRGTGDAAVFRVLSVHIAAQGLGAGAAQGVGDA